MYLASEVYFLCEHCFICMATDDIARDRIQKKGPIPERNRSKWLLLLRAGTLFTDKLQQHVLGGEL
jgi:hypothetical protein